MREKIKHLLEVFDLRKFIKFGLIGVLNTIVDLVVFYIAHRLICLGMGLSADALDNPAWLTAVAQAISFVVANVHSFIWNKFWTFQKRNRVTKKEAGRYVVTSVGYYLLSLVLIRAVAAVFHVPDTIAKLPATCCMILYNYLMNKFWVFK